MSDFHLLLEEQIPRLIRYACALTRDRDEAGDLVEDTVRDALARRRECPQDVAGMRVWLLTTLHDLRGNPFRQASFPAAAPSRDPTAALTLSRLDRALGQLPEDLRAIILLIGLEGMSYGATAAILRLPIGTVRSRLSRGHVALRQLMGVGKPTARIARAA